MTDLPKHFRDHLLVLDEDLKAVERDLAMLIQAIPEETNVTPEKKHGP